jgi:hypothetical protein
MWPISVWQYYLSQTNKTHNGIGYEKILQDNGNKKRRRQEGQEQKNENSES